MRLPPILNTGGASFLRGSSASPLGLSWTALGGQGNSFGDACRNPRELVFPPALKQIGDGFWRGSPSLERVDQWGTALESLDGWFSGGCRILRELVFPPRLGGSVTVSGGGCNGWSAMI